MAFKDVYPVPYNWFVGDGGTKKITIAIADGASSGETIITGMNCLIKQILFVIPALEGSHTAELKIQNEDDKDLFTSGELAESTTHNILAERQVVGDISFKVESSGTETTGVTIYVYIYFS